MTWTCRSSCRGVRGEAAPWAPSANAVTALCATGESLSVRPDAYYCLHAKLVPKPEGSSRGGRYLRSCDGDGAYGAEAHVRGGRYDIVIDLEPQLLRVQCKLARELDGVLPVPTHTNRYTPSGYVSTQYTPDEVDAVAAYATKTQRCYLLPIDVVTSRRGVHLRLAPAKNNQAQGIRWARDYEFETSLRRHWHAPKDDLSASGLAGLKAIP